MIAPFEAQSFFSVSLLVSFFQAPFRPAITMMG